MDTNMSNEVLDLEVLESRLEMESLAAASPALQGTSPVCICPF